MGFLQHYKQKNLALSSKKNTAANIIVFIFLFTLLYTIIKTSQPIFAPLSENNSLKQLYSLQEISNDPTSLPYYALRSLLRMFTALGFSLIFTLIYATVAARFKTARIVLIPILDILQSVPILGFLSITLTMWLTLFPNSVLGLEMAAIFAIFTSQVWNMTFSFYESLVTQSKELNEVTRLMRLTSWQRFCKLDLPSGTIALVWNSIMSFGGGWFFLVASEAISVNNEDLALPGIGSFVAKATKEGNVGNIVAASIMMILVILAVNFFFWQPLTTWAEKFRDENSTRSDAPKSIILNIWKNSQIPNIFSKIIAPIFSAIDYLTRFFSINIKQVNTKNRQSKKTFFVLSATIFVTLAIILYNKFIISNNEITFSEILLVFKYGLLTLGRVIVVLIFASLVWVPLGVLIGMNPKINKKVQPIVQILASFPANFLFPLVTIFLIKTGISLNWGGILLMGLGSQWYILFNVAGGASRIPNELNELSKSLQLTNFLRWKNLLAPAIFSSYITGCITAAGGAWNASILAEYVTYKDSTLSSPGLGYYITTATQGGDFTKVFLGVAMMSFFVVTINKLFWRRLYLVAETRYTL